MCWDYSLKSYCYRLFVHLDQPKWVFNIVPTVLLVALYDPFMRTQKCVCPLRLLLQIFRFFCFFNILFLFSLHFTFLKVFPSPSYPMPVYCLSLVLDLYFLLCSSIVCFSHQPAHFPCVRVAPAGLL